MYDEFIYAVNGRTFVHLYTDKAALSDWYRRMVNIYGSKFQPK